MPSRYKVSLAFDGWISMNKCAITSVISYAIDRNSALREVHLGFDKVGKLLFSNYER